MTDRAEFERKLARARAELAAAGIRPSPYDLWLDRWLRRLGLRLRPLPYRALWRYGVAMGLYFVSFWGLWMWLLVWSADGMPVFWAIAGSLVAGVLCGLFMAGWQARDRRRHRFMFYID